MKVAESIDNTDLDLLKIKDVAKTASNGLISSLRESNLSTNIMEREFFDFNDTKLR